MFHEEKEYFEFGEGNGHNLIQMSLCSWLAMLLVGVKSDLNCNNTTLSTAPMYLE